jgi:nickel-dependent lactate racemase
MKIKLEYGREGLDIELPDQNVIGTLSYREAIPLESPQVELRRVLRTPHGAPPLVELARGKQQACILICDVTRPVPNPLILGEILRDLEEAGMARDQILILVATGLHRPNLGDELREMVGDEIFEGYRIENHDGQDLESHVHLGESPNGVPIWIDRRYVEADLKITTGLIEPHFMAGFSGGRKLICPGIAGIDTIRAWHSPQFLEHPKAASGFLEGNPVHAENTWIAQHTGCDFIVNVVIDDQRRPLKFVAGDMITAFQEGVDFVRDLVTDTVPQEVDVVVTSSAGYPLDTTFYQSVKGMVGAAAIVKTGGTIVIAASMSEGIGSPEFQEIFDDHPTLDGFLDHILNRGYFKMDQWQLEELAKARKKAQIKVVTDGLTPETINRLYVDSSPSVESAVAECLQEYGSEASIAVIPKGPYVMATVASPPRFDIHT